MVKSTIKIIKNKGRLRLLFVAALLLLFLSDIGIAESLSNSGGGTWKYQREISIKENSGTTLTDYQVLIELKGADFPNEAQNNGADIRFTDSSGKELNYWIESWNAGKSANVWIKLPNIPAGSISKVFLHYANPNAISTSNGKEVFEFFDDFNDNDLTDWNIVLNNDVFFEKNNRMQYSAISGSDIDNLIVKGANNVPIFNFVFEFKSLTLGGGGMGNLRHSGWTLWTSDSQYLAYVNFVGGAYFNQVGYSFDIVQNNGISGIGTEATYKIIYDGSSLKMYKENAKIFEAIGTLASNIRFGLNGERGGSTTENSAMWDDFRVRKHTSPEPTVIFAPPNPSSLSATPSTTLIPTTTAILVTSFPSGANVYIDGIYKGITPIKLSDLPQDSPIVKLMLEGYNDWQQNINIASEKTTYFSVALEPSTMHSLRLIPGEEEKLLEKFQNEMSSFSRQDKENLANIHFEEGKKNSAKGNYEEAKVYFLIAKAISEDLKDQNLVENAELRIENVNTNIENEEFIKLVYELVLALVAAIIFGYIFGDTFEKKTTKKVSKNLIIAVAFFILFAFFYTLGRLI